MKPICWEHWIFEQVLVDSTIISHDWHIVIVDDEDGDALDNVDWFLFSVIFNNFRISNSDLGIFSCASGMIIYNKDIKSDNKALEHLWRFFNKHKQVAISVLQYFLELREIKKKQTVCQLRW